MSRGLFLERGSRVGIDNGVRERHNTLQDSAAGPAISHLTIGTSDLREDAHHWTDEMKESHGCFVASVIVFVPQRKM